MLRFRYRRATFLFVLLLLSLFIDAKPLTGQDRVQINLRPQIVAKMNIATISEVADLVGGPANTRLAMGELDLAIDLGAGFGVSKSETVARLMLAGFSRDQFIVAGAEQVRLMQPGIAIDSATISAAISQHVALSFGIPSEDVSVEISKLPEIQPVPSGVEIEIKPLDHADQIIGNRAVTLGVFHGTQMLQQVRVVAQTRYLRDVLVARIPIEKGEQLNHTNSFMRKTQFDRVSRVQPIDTSVLGKTTARRIRGQQMIRATDISVARQSVESEFLVRARAPVTAVASKGTLRVTMSGLEAMKPGKLGETIPVKNLATRKVLYGRVVDINVVEVSF